MPMTFQIFFTRVRDAVEKDLGHAVDDEYTGAFCHAALQVLDLQINDRGEIVPKFEKIVAEITREP